MSVEGTGRIPSIKGWWGSQSPDRQSALWLAGVVIGYALVTLIATWPLIGHLRTAFPGARGDQFEKTYLLWHTAHALVRGQNPGFFRLLVYPNGAFSAVRFAQLALFVLAAPLTLILAPVAAYNVVFLLSYVLTGAAGYLLCLDVNGDRRAAAFGGLLLMLFPLRVAHALDGHVEFASLYMIVLYMLMLRRTLRQPSTRSAVFTGLWLGLAALFHITNPPYVLLWWTAIYLGWYLIKNRATGETWRALGVAFGVGALIVIPFYLPLLGELRESSAGIVEGGTVAYSADLLSFASPSPDNPVLSAAGLIPAYARAALAGEPQEVTAYLGLIPLALAALALLRRAPESGVWLAVALVAMALSLGPILKVGGEPVTLSVESAQTYLTLPYALIGKLPLLSVGRTVGRMNVLTGIALMVLAAEGASAWLRGDGGWRIGALGAASLLLVGEYLVEWPLPLRDATIPPTVEQLAEIDGEGAVLNLPVHVRQVWHTAEYYQSAHGWPIMGGYVDRALPQTPGLLPMYDWLTDILSEADIVPAPAEGQVGALLAGDEVAYVLLHRNLTQDPARLDSELRAWLGEPVGEDARTALYQVRAEGPPDEIIYGLGQPAWRDVNQYGWSHPEAWSGRPARWLTQGGDLILYAPQAATGTLTFDALVGDRPRHLDVSLNGEHLATLVIGQYTTYTLPEVALGAGYNVIRFDVREPCWAVSGDARCRVNRALAQDADLDAACWLADPAPARCLDVLFQEIRFHPAETDSTFARLDVPLGESLTLVGYRLADDTVRAGEALPVTLVWRADGSVDAEGSIGEDLNVFVHLFRERDGAVELAAQFDGPPLREAYPTSAWLPGDLVQERVTLDVPADVSPGVYTLAAGLYRLPSVERLPVGGDRPYAQDGLVWLGEVTVGE
jgi:hypothetical protein